MVNEKSMTSKRLIAHRGLMAHYPENTLLGFEQAIKAGAKLIECDIQLLGDGTPVIIHDDNLKRTAGEDISLDELSKETIKHYSVHEPERFNERYHPQRLMLLDEFIQWLSALSSDSASLSVLFEIKRQSVEKYGTKAVADSVFPLIKAFAGKAFVISFRPDILALARAEQFSIGYILTSVNDVFHDEARRLSAELVFCNIKKIPDKSDIPWTDIPSQWVIYDLINPEEIDYWFTRGISYIETADIRSLLLKSGNNHIESKSRQPDNA